MGTPESEGHPDVLDIVFSGEYEMLTPQETARYTANAHNMGEADSGAHTYIEGGAKYYGRFVGESPKYTYPSDIEQLAG